MWLVVHFFSIEKQNSSRLLLQPRFGLQYNSHKLKITKGKAMWDACNVAYIDRLPRQNNYKNLLRDTFIETTQLNPTQIEDSIHCSHMYKKVVSHHLIVSTTLTSLDYELSI